ncbi:MAG: iron-sulfur cluster assembly accessory protein [Bacteroidota bacterium]|nr:iron-sulfur cluster assembly accessory protein [Bacteroidota bacterium]
MEDLVLESGIKKGVSLTPGAVKEIKRLIAEQHIGDDKGLRIGVKGGGCAGFSYILEFDTLKEADTIYNIEGVKILVDLTHELYLAGTEVDFEQGLNSRGFMYKNPNASKTCGCGESFG